MRVRILIYCVATLAVIFACRGFSETSAVSNGTPDAASQYATHFSKMIADYDQMAELLATVENTESAEAICEDVTKLCNGMRLLLVEAASLPALTPHEAARVQQAFTDSTREELNEAASRLVNAAVRAAERAPRSPALLRLSNDFRSLSNDVNAFVARMKASP